MPGADGSIWIKIKADDEQAQKEIARLNKDISRTEKNIESLGQKKMPLVEQAKELGVRLDAAKEKLANMQSGNEFFPSATVKTQQEEVNSLQKQWDSVNDKLDGVNAKLQAAENTLSAQKTEAGELEQQIASVGTGTRAMADAAASAEKRMEAFSKRVKGLFKRVLVFSVITVALRSMREWMGKVIKTNAEATAAMARLKGALLTLAQPLVNVIIPAFTTLVNVLSAVVGRVAALVSGLFGSTAKASSEAAEELYKQTDALEKTGAAAEKAEGSLASFDEINTLSSNNGAGGSKTDEPIVPDFSWADGISDKLKSIADSVLLIAAGLALWKIGTLLPGTLGIIATTLGGILVFVGGLLLAWNGLTDAWENGVDWDNMAMMIAGVAAAAAGLWLAFGNVAAGIGLVVGGIAMLVVGFKDMFENGFNVKNMLLVIAGMLAAGLGIGLITGNWIPLLIGAIASVLLAIAGLTGNGQQLINNLKDVFNGFLKFITGMFTGDLEMAVEGTEQMLKGLANAAATLLGSVVNLIIEGLNWLISKINSIRFNVPDWVPLIGGKRLSPNIPQVKKWNIPQLAQGTVVPPNREFMAVLGDNKTETEIVSPLSTMKQAFLEALQESGGMGGDIRVELLLDGKKLAANQVKHINDMTKAAGKSVLFV